jgi:hypothetical protein
MVRIAVVLALLSIPLVAVVVAAILMAAAAAVDLRVLLPALAMIKAVAVVALEAPIMWMLLYQIPPY